MFELNHLRGWFFYDIILSTMRSGYDINQIQGDGYLILPLSMSRLSNAQSPEKCYEIFEFFLSKFEEYSNDAVLLYTSSIYMNSKEISFERRKKIRQQALNHSTALRSLIQKEKDFMPRAFHFLPADYFILNSRYYNDYLSKLQKLKKEDEQFRECLKEDARGRDLNEANTNFLLEEIVITHILRQQLVELPNTLAKKDNWRLIVYPGEYIKSDLYQWRHDVLPEENSDNPFGGAHYNYSEKEIYLFDEMGE